MRHFATRLAEMASMALDRFAGRAAPLHLLHLVALSAVQTEQYALKRLKTW